MEQNAPDGLLLTSKTCIVIINKVLLFILVQYTELR